MLVADLVLAMESIAPPSLAEPWDKVGLQIGRHEADLNDLVLLTIDLTDEVLKEAIERNAGAIVSYHPPIWKPLERITGADAKGRVLLDAVRAGIAVYTPHTALDATRGGVTDWLCAALAGSAFDPDQPVTGGDVRALRPIERQRTDQQTKIVTFVPESHIEQVRQALASAGAGIIGGYQVCSFAVTGAGTFFGGDETQPAVGEKGRLETVDEHRLEMVCGRSALPLAVETLRNFHPYEEPPIDVYDLRPAPERALGVGRRLVLDQPATLAELGQRLRVGLGHSRIKLAPPDAAERTVTHIGVVPGAGEDLYAIARDEGCEVFVTGEMRHHSVLAALHDDLCVLLAGHTNTERGYLPHLGARLHKAMPEVAFQVSQRDADPLRVV